MIQSPTVALMPGIVGLYMPASSQSRQKGPLTSLSTRPTLVPARSCKPRGSE